MTCTEHDSFLDEYDEPEKMTADEAFRVDYEWFRSFGMNDASIARSFGITANALQRRMQRDGISSVPQNVLDALDELVSSGRDFTVTDLPYVESQNISGLLNRYVREKRIRPVGVVRSGRYDGTRMKVYRSAVS